MTAVPEWIQVLQALLTPMIAIAVMVIGFLQWRTAHQKVVLDLFDRRMAIYGKVKQSMRLINGSGKVSEESDRLLLDAQNDAAFLFGADVRDYLDDLWSLYIQSRTIQRENGSSAEETSAQRTKLHMAVSDFYNFGPERFAQYMRMDQKRVRTPKEWLLERNAIRNSYADKR